MMKFHRLILFTVLASLLLPGIAISQVVVEKSKEKVIISGKPYYIHIVNKGETVYSISRAYGISTQEFTKENPSAGNGVKTGQSLRIPIVDNIQKTGTPVQATRVQRDESKYIYHKLNPGETIFSLSKRYGVSEDEIVKSNPGIEIVKMPVGYEIAIPRRQFMKAEKTLPAQQTNIVEHKVLKGENLYSIAEKYGISVKEIRRENKGLLFPKVDEFIRVPVKIEQVQVLNAVPMSDTVSQVTEEVPRETAVGITPVTSLEGTMNVAVLLPFYFEENSIRYEIDSSRTSKGKPVHRFISRPEEWIYTETLGFLELYEGILVATDTLRSLGLNINLHVYDIKSDTVALTRLIESGALRDMNLIIGPVYSRNLSIMASYANSFGIPVISPVQLRNNSPLDNNPFLFMANPSIEVAQEAIAKRTRDFPDNNFIFIHADTSGNNQSVESFKNKIFRELTEKVQYEDIKFKEFIFYSRSTFNYDSINRLEHALSDQARNFVIVASEDLPVMSESIANLHTLSKRFDIRLMGYPAMRGLDSDDLKNFFDLGIEIYSPYWIDKYSSDVKNFNSTFFKKFHTEPAESSFAWEGYDIAYFFLSGLAIHGKEFATNPGIHNPDLLQTSFHFKRKSSESGFENQKLYLIKFTNDMDIKLLEETDTTSAEPIR